MEEFTIEAELRTGLGKKPVKAIRKQNNIPGILYSAGKQTMHITVPLASVKSMLKLGTNELVKINIKTDSQVVQKIALIKDVQKHVVTYEPLHIDFYEIAKDKPIKINVPVMVSGRSKGVELGGILQILARALTVKCLPTAIPKHIEIDVTELAIGHTLHVRNLTPIEGLEFIDNADMPVVHVLVPAKEEVVATVTAEVAPTAAEPEVIKKGKEAKEGAEPEKTAPEEHKARQEKEKK
ncbi:MAG: 50S ribosomal protein L25 [Deltaproteobacteria bacterium]|nr:50S ribosomal protein L25 [Deltaproteobacteria bacterium]MCL5793140.1 50S ribosomal protein L25 [Deltaproteobacteria bacterium]